MTNDLFELKPSEIAVPVVFREGGARFRVTHIFRPPSLDDWLSYEESLDTRIREVGQTSRVESQTLESCEALWERCATRVEGYHLAGGGNLAETLPDWKARIPLNHKTAAVRGLAQVAVSDPAIDDEQPYQFDPEAIEITLEAARDGRVLTGLRHRLRRPTPQELKEFSRIASSTVWMRGARVPTTLLPSRLRSLVKMYDNLVLSVAGYSLDGQPAATREAAQKAMDAMHKKVAMQALFAPEDDSTAREAETA